ncbi:DNA-binding protein [Angelica bushy stunt virus]|uniref:Virion-associated protein n=1 Tax=Angelica bushy stunt virus TaxID=1808970 RepID=A0A140GL60_9VIRU|nr:DNA-binding protein [Angelica bushy stunt virus]AMN10078.1 DNA-binding protein [Angelica bushy stunt virus]
MASVNTISKDLENIVIPILKEIKEMLNSQKQDSIKELIEAASAKIIMEMKKCPCNEEILAALNKQPESKDKQIVPFEEQSEKPRRMLYSFPNDSVGFEQLGTGKNKNSIVWPPQGKQ